jgi:hypothetical protein
MSDENTAQFAALKATLDAMRAEGHARGLEQSVAIGRLESNVVTLGHEVGRQGHELVRLGVRIGHLEGGHRKLQEKDAEIARQTSDHALEAEAAIGGAKAHAEVTDRAIRAICLELGLDFSEIVTPSIPPPGSKPKKKPRTTLQRLERGGKIGTAAILAAFVIRVLAELAASPPRIPSFERDHNHASEVSP